MKRREPELLGDILTRLFMVRGWSRVAGDSSPRPPARVSGLRRVPAVQPARRPAAPMKSG
jgi:hypothetical protein